MTRITMDEVKHVANLARLAITEEEAEKLTNAAWMRLFPLLNS